MLSLQLNGTEQIEQRTHKDMTYPLPCEEEVKQMKRACDQSLITLVPFHFVHASHTVTPQNLWNGGKEQPMRRKMNERNWVNHVFVSFLSLLSSFHSCTLFTMEWKERKKRTNGIKKNGSECEERKEDKEGKLGTTIGTRELLIISHRNDPRSMW